MTFESPREARRQAGCGCRAAPYPLFQEDHRRSAETQTNCGSSLCLCGLCGSVRWPGRRGGAVPPLSTNSSSVLLRQDGVWHPLLQRCDACTCANTSSSNKIQRIYTGLKITACMAGANSEQKTKKKKKNHKKTPTASSEELVAKTKCWEQKKAGYRAWPLHSTPPEGWAKHLSHLSGLMPGHSPTLIPFQKPAHLPPQGVSRPLLQPQKPQ